MTFDELALDLINKTNGFTELNGAYKVVSKADVQNAETILRTYYQNVDKKKLDYTNNDAEGIDYVIRFDTPLYNFDLEESIKMNEDYVIKPTYRTKGVTREDVEKYAELLGLDYETALRRWKRIQAPESNYERVLDRLEPVDEAIEKHDTLNPKLWDGNQLKPEVEEKLREIVQKFDDNLKENDVELNVKDICIIGSNANYNYSPDSDVDLHIVADTSVYPDQEDLAMKVYLAYKSLFNNKYDPTINGVEVEIYVEPDAVQANSNGVYSLDNGWLKEPEQVDVPEIDPEHVQELIQPYEDRYTQLISGDPTVEDVDKLIDDIYLQRQSSIMKDGEFGDGNICFKEFRNRGYLQSLRDLKVELENKEMSLNDMNEQLLGIYGLNEDCDCINEDLTEDDLFVGAEFIEPDTGSKIVITGIEDDLVTYDESRDGVEPITITDPISYFVSTLNEYDYVLDENCNKELKEDIFENENGMEISFPDPRDTLAVFLEWEGIMGYTDEIYDVAQEGYDALDEFLEYEGIIGYTSKIYEIINTGSAWCSQMEMEDFLSVCKSLYIDYTLAVDDDIDEKLDESGDFYLGSKWNNKNDRDRYFRTVPKYRVKDKRTGKSFTAQCGRWDSIDDVKNEYPEDKYEVKLVEATKVGLVSAAKSALNKYCDKLKDASAEEVYNKALEHASKSEYPFVKDNLTAKKDIAIDYINKRKEAMSTDDLDEDFVIDDKPGTKYRNKNGIILKMEEPTEDGEIQFAIIDNGEIIDHRKMSDLKSFARMVDANGYEKLNEDDNVPKKIAKDYVIHDKKELDDFKADNEMFAGLFVKDENNFPKALRLVADEYGGRDLWVEIPLDKAVVTDQLSLFDEKLTEDTVKQGDKWVNKGKEGTHGKFKTKKAADDQRKAMFANGYHESLDEGTAFDGMPGYMTPEEIRAKKLADKEKLDAEKEQVKAQKAAERKEKAKAERARQKRIDQRAKVNSLSYDSLADMAGLPEDNNDLTKDELLAVLRASMSDEEILKLHKQMFEDYEVGIQGGPYENDDDYILDQNPDYDNGLPDPDDIPFKDDYELTESHKDYDLIFDRDTGDRQVEYGINWIQFYTDNYEDAVRWVRQLDAAIAGDIDKYGEPSDDPKYYDPENYPGDIQKFAEHEYNFRRPRDILASIPKVDFVDKDDDIKDLDETVTGPLNEDTDFTNKAAALSEYLDVEPSDISDTPEENVFEVSNSGQEYFVGTEEEAHAKAVEEIKMLFDDMGLDSFTKNFQDEILRDYIDESAVDEFIESELDYFRNDDPDEGMVNYLENLTDRVDYIKDTLGPDSFASWAKDKIDLDAMADEAIRQDGEAHFIAYYDGNEIDLGHGLFAYRMN